MPKTKKEDEATVWMRFLSLSFIGGTSIAVYLLYRLFKNRSCDMAIRSCADTLLTDLYSLDVNYISFEKLKEYINNNKFDIPECYSNLLKENVERWRTEQGEGTLIRGLATVENFRLLLAYSIQCDQGRKTVVPDNMIRVYYTEICKMCKEYAYVKPPLKSTFKRHPLWNSLVLDMVKHGILLKKK